jgi:hypothetical protein
MIDLLSGSVPIDTGENIDPLQALHAGYTIKVIYCGCSEAGRRGSCVGTLHMLIHGVVYQRQVGKRFTALTQYNHDRTMTAVEVFLRAWSSADATPSHRWKIA